MRLGLMGEALHPKTHFQVLDSRVGRYVPLMIRIAVKRVKKIRVMKIILIIARVNNAIMERDVVGAINIGLRHLTSNGNQWRWAREGPMRHG